MGDIADSLRKILGKAPTEAEHVVAEVVVPEVLAAHFDPEPPAHAHVQAKRAHGRRSRMRQVLGRETREGAEIIESLLAMMRGQNGEAARDRLKATIALMEFYFGKQVAVSGAVKHAHEHTGNVTHTPAREGAPDLSRLSTDELMQLRALRLKAATLPDLSGSTGQGENPDKGDGK